MKLIDKSAVIEEIKRHKALWDGMNSDYSKGQRIAYSDMLSILNTIEVKEVDLEKELDKYTTNNFWALEGNSESPYLVEKDDMLKIAKHFYELGLKAQKGE